MPYKNYADAKAFRRRYKAVNRERLREQRNREGYGRKSEKKARSLKGLIIASYRSQPCEDCGGKFPPYVMEFDHTRGEKVFCIGSHHASVQDLLDEIDKCDIVCANCHKIRSHERNQFGRKD